MSRVIADGITQRGIDEKTGTDLSQIPTNQDLADGVSTGGVKQIIGDFLGEGTSSKRLVMLLNGPGDFNDPNSYTIGEIYGGSKDANSPRGGCIKLNILGGEVGQGSNAYIEWATHRSGLSLITCDYNGEKYFAILFDISYMDSRHVGWYFKGMRLSNLPSSYSLVTEEDISNINTWARGQNSSPIYTGGRDGDIVDIIENSNGTAVRWESGLQVCWGPKIQGTADSGFGSIYRSGSGSYAHWDFPASFSSEPWVNACNNDFKSFAFSLGATLSNADFSLVSSVSGRSISVKPIAWGFYK